MKHLLLAVLVFTFGMAPPAPGQTQREMTAGAAAEYTAADAKLNKIYKTVLAGVDGEGKAKLIAAQRTWIAWRDAEAEYRCAGSAGGSIQPMERYVALTELTRARIDMLTTYRK